MRKSFGTVMTEEEKSRKAQLHLRAEPLGMAVHYSNAPITDLYFGGYYVVARHPDHQSYNERILGKFFNLDEVESFIVKKEAEDRL